MPHGVRIEACQGRPANTAPCRTMIAHTAARFDRVEFSLMPFVTGLSTTLAAARRAWLPGWRTRSITRGRLRTVTRRSPGLFPEPLSLGAQAADFLFQRGQPLQHLQQRLLDTGRRQRPVFRSNLDVGRSQQLRFHWPEITKSSLVLHAVFSTPVNGYNGSFREDLKTRLGVSYC